MTSQQQQRIHATHTYLQRCGSVVKTWVFNWRTFPDLCL